MPDRLIRFANDPQLRSILDSLPLAVWTAESDGNVTFANRFLFDYLEIDDNGLGGDLWFQYLHPEDREASLELWRSAVQQELPYQADFRLRCGDGSYRWFRSLGQVQRDGDGRALFWLGTCSDIQSLKESQDQTEKLTARLHSTFESISDAVLILDRDWNAVTLNREGERLLERKREDLAGRNIWDLFPEARGSLFQLEYERAVREGVSIELLEYFPPLERWFQVRAFPSDDGLSIFFADVTQKLAVEEQMRQSQRLETVGQLTGGVAHDFNNLLTVIVGNTELLLEGDSDPEEQRELLETTRQAAKRGAELTHHLLAFARKQALEPRSIRLQQLLTGIEPLLRRTFPESISLEFVHGGGLWEALVDPTQLESAILNLCLNARDAMPHGGRLTVETANARLDSEYAALHSEVIPGQYVMIACSDTGGGIPEELLDRVFDPFFSTKEVGKGTGLGLSMVYGFVKQSGGHVKLYSEVGSGTTVRLYLPRAAEAQTPTSSVGSRSEKCVRPFRPGKEERILVVEDEELVRRHACRQLQSLGYQVVSACDGREALELLRNDPEIALLFTDVVMPGGMNGRQLAEAALLLRPNLKVLYTSGYTDNAIVHHGCLDPGLSFLSKPYDREELARKVRYVLDLPESGEDEEIGV